MPITDFRITALTFSGGQQIALEPGSLLLLVGPNNAGKSATLREIGTWLAPDLVKLSSAPYV
jgi:ABC-type multidrug transport system ATPase subunit